MRFYSLTCFVHKSAIMQERNCSVVAYLLKDRKFIEILTSCAELGCWIESWVKTRWVCFEVFRTLHFISQPFSICCIHQFSNAEPFVLINFETALNEFSEVRRYFGSVYRRFQYFLFELGLSFTGFEWSISMKKFIDDDSKSPYISFRTILVVNQAFRTHVDGTPNVEIFELVFVFYCKTKVSNFSSSILWKKDVR